MEIKQSKVITTEDAGMMQPQKSPTTKLAA